MIQAQEYINERTGEHRVIPQETDNNGRVPMYVYVDGDEWRAMPKYNLSVINSKEFFDSAHEFRVKTTLPPLDGSDFAYGLT